MRDQVGDRLEVGYEDLGEQQVKNISRPIRVFKVLLNGRRRGGERSRLLDRRRQRPRRAPRKPSIAVLPFVNMSGDPEQEFFADGLTEDIITELSRFRELLVISRNAVFVHKGKPVKAQQIAREFGVDYVVEGSVRKAADRVRVTVQLIDGETETHIWAERYDRKLEDIFAIQDEVTSVDRRDAVRPRRGREARPRAAQAHREHGGLRVCADRQGPAPSVQSRSQRRGASHARSRHRARSELRACARLEGVRDRPGVAARLVRGPRRHAVQVISDELQTALSLDDNDADVHRILAALKLNFNEHDKATYHQERALSLNPNSDLIVVQQGEVLTWLGRPEEGIEWIRRAMRLNPYHPERFWSHLGRAQYTARLYADAIESFSKLTAPDHTHHAFLAASSAQLGNRTAAGAHAREVLQRQPTFTRRELPGNASLSAARGQRTRARRAAEGGAAKVIAHRPPIRSLTIWLIVAGDAETHSAATAPNLSKHRTNRVPLAAAHPRIASQFVNSRARYAQLG